MYKERERWNNFESIYHWNSWGKRSSKWRGICNPKFLNYLWQVRNEWCYNTGACKVRVIRVNLSLKRSFWFLRCCSNLNASFNSSSSLAGQNPSKASPSLKTWGKKQNETHVLIYLFQRLLFFSYLQYHDGSLSFPTELAAVILHKLLQGILTQKAVPILNKSFSYLVQGLWH